jgi:hypothetical protein
MFLVCNSLLLTHIPQRKDASAMSRLQVGDEVKVVGSSSKWRGSRGRVQEIIEHGSDPDKRQQECAVASDTARCWFTTEHLAKIIPSRLLRFFQYEFAERWGFDSDEMRLVTGDRDDLVSLLQTYHGLVKRRAQAEVEALFDNFFEKIRTATSGGANASPPTPRSEINTAA